MAITLVPKYVRALAEQLNAYYRVLKGVDADSVELRLPGGGRFAVHHSGTNAVVFQVTDAGATGSYAPGDITNPDIADGAVTSAKIADDTIVNADVNAAAAIAVTKLAHVGANNVLRSTGGVNVGGQVVSGDIANDTIVDADVNSAAGILVTKIAHVGAGNVLRSTGSQNVGGPLVASDIPNNSITSAKIVDNEIVNGDINAAAGIVYGKLALANGVVNADINAGAAISPSKLAAVAAGQILKDVGSGVVGGGLLVDANVAAAGTANIALGKLAPGASGLVKSNGTAISAGNQLVAADLPTGGAAIITSAMIVDGTIATSDMTANSINGDRISDGTIVGAKLSGGAPPPSGGGAADAYKVYATDSAGTTVALRQVLTEMLASNATLQRQTAAPSGSASTLGSWAIMATASIGITTSGYPVRLDFSLAINSSTAVIVSIGYRLDGAAIAGLATHNVTAAGAWQQISGHMWVPMSDTPTAPVAHSIDLAWQSASGTLSAGSCAFTVSEYKKVA